MTKWILPIALFIVILVGLLALVLIPAPKTAVAPATNSTTTPTQTQTRASLDDLIVVTSPLPQAKVSSPLTLSGKARGSWYFEASAPYILKDASGNIIAQGHIDAQSDWMTSEYVPFTSTITFPPQPAGSLGTLILKNDNPSGDPSRQKELDIPVRF